MCKNLYTLNIINKNAILKLERLNKNNRASSLNNVFTDHQFYPRFVNRSNVIFENSELHLIGKGFKHNIQAFNNKKDFEILGVDCEEILNNNS